MKTTNYPSVVQTATLFAFMSAAILNAQAASLVSGVTIGASNDRGIIVPFDSGATNDSGTGGFITAAGSADFSGLDSNNEAATMSFSGTGTASAGYGILRTAASGSVSGVYYNPNNDIYYDRQTGVNPNGSPTFLASIGQAQFFDTLNYGNVPAGFKTNFFFNVTGNFSGTDTYQSILVEFGSQSDVFSLQPANGPDINQVWVTKKFSPLPGVDFDFATTMLSQFDLQPAEVNEGESYTGNVDFLNTVTLAGVNVFDENDNLITGWTLTSGSGTVYNIPEPSGVLLSLVGAVGFFMRRRRA